MEVLKLMKQGRNQELLDILPEFIDNSAAEVKAGSLAWMLSALGIPAYPAEIHAYGTVIGTGNAVVEWDHENSGKGYK
jgi:2-aminophenol/2-amino-5-chlorophenol 1,6-dioxygenase beta subunit